jgi:nucleoside-diphosphate-sugar epimerase
MPERRVALVGGAGYVGLVAARVMRDAGLAPVIVCGRHRSLVCEREGIAWQDAASPGPTALYDVVVNFAYPAQGPRYERLRANRGLSEQLGRLLDPCGHVVHLSSLAVFGHGLDRPVSLHPQRLVSDYEYIMSKIAMERLLIGRFGRNALTIIRLGNVIGPGAAWTVNLIERLRAERPIVFTDRPGFSNATDVLNTAHALCHLVLAEQPSGTHIAHLAEFSAIPWRTFADGLAPALGVTVPPPYPPAPTSRPVTGIELLRGSVRRATSSRVRGGFVTRTLASCPRPLLRLLQRVRGPYGGSVVREVTDEGDSVEELVFGSTREFRSAGLDRIEVPLDEQGSLHRIRQWMEAVGY